MPWESGDEKSGVRLSSSPDARRPERFVHLARRGPAIARPVLLRIFPFLVFST